LDGARARLFAALAGGVDSAIIRYRDEWRKHPKIKTYSAIL